MKTRYILLGIVACVLIGNLFGCARSGSRGDEQAKSNQSEKEMAAELMQSVIDALEAEDGEALKGLFSAYALEYADDLDEGIDELISFYPGSNGGYSVNVPVHRTSDYGEIIYVITPEYHVTNDDEVYDMVITAYLENDAEPERVGVHIIEVMTPEAEPEGFKWRDEEDNPGVYVLR